MSTWQSHPIEDQPAEFQHLGELHEIAEEEHETIESAGLTVHPDGVVEYHCVECHQWSVNHVGEPCVHYGECLSCYLTIGQEVFLRPAGYVETGPIPPEVPWSELRAYRCGACKEWCINWDASPCALADECITCFTVPALEDAPEIKEIEGTGPIPPEVSWSELEAYECRSCGVGCINWEGLPRTRTRYCNTCYELVQPSHLSHPPAASEGEGAEARLRAGLSRPEGAAERPEAAPEATDPEADPLPWGSDPEARAQPPTPQGEGATRTASPASRRAE